MGRVDGLDGNRVGEILVLTDWSIDGSRGRRKGPATEFVEDRLHILTMVCLRLQSLVERLSKDGPWDSELWAQPRPVAGWGTENVTLGATAVSLGGYMASLLIRSPYASAIHDFRSGLSYKSKTAVFRGIEVIRDVPLPRLSSPFSFVQSSRPGIRPVASKSILMRQSA
jgi:hypothetical protein